jgi:aromatic ring-opening dioxygenase catalytic subunit (LigB family)
MAAFRRTPNLHYRAPGSPELAGRVQQLLAQAGEDVRADEQRGYDHGMFVPMAVIYPQADVPVLQLSLRSNLNAAEHLAVGRALAPLRDEGVLIIGSGSSYHNMRSFGPVGRAPSKLFDDWLAETLMQMTPAARSQRLADWERAPGARGASAGGASAAVVVGRPSKTRPAAFTLKRPSWARPRCPATALRPGRSSELRLFLLVQWSIQKFFPVIVNRVGGRLKIG